MSKTSLSLDEIYALAHDTMMANGCDEANAGALADIVMRAERDGSHSHGLFRVPGYVKALRSGKVDGKAKPTVTKKTPAIIHVDGHGCFAPLAQAAGLPVLAEATAEIGVAALSLTGVHHFAALWPETEFLADRGLVGIACTAYMPMVAPSGTREKLFGTNPISFAWPRPGKPPVCYDMATAALSCRRVPRFAHRPSPWPLLPYHSKPGVCQGGARQRKSDWSRTAFRVYRTVPPSAYRRYRQYRPGPGQPEIRSLATMPQSDAHRSVTAPPHRFRP